MADDKNPKDDKPSFFDFSDEEASSWPPSEAPPTEETTTPKEIIEESSTGDDDDFNVEDLFSDDLEEDPEPVFEKATKLDIDLVPVEPKEEAAIVEESNDFESVTKELEPEPDLIQVEPSPEEENEIIFEQPNLAEEAEMEPLFESSFEEDQEKENQEDEESVDALFTDYSEPSTEEFTAYKPVETPDLPETTLAFRTFTTFDYVDEAITGDGEDKEEEEKQGINRNILILLLTFVLVGGWYGYKAIFVKDYAAKTGRSTRAPKKKTTSLTALEKELVPVWELSSQKYTNDENDFVTTVYENSGRDNPFLLPNSVIADMMKAAELELIKKQKPNTYRRKAYRATLVGVLTSTENTLAVVNYQEAVFDVLEGTAKDKILKLATKAMDKAKEDTQEMVVGSYIGPWQIKIVEAPEDAFIEPRITIENGSQRKVLNMGKAEELGIFDDDGNIDNLEEPVDEVSLDDFDW